MGNKVDASALVTLLKAATAGLKFQSEADYPVKPFVWEGAGKTAPTSQAIFKLSEHAAGTPIKTVPLDRFFQHATEDMDWHNAEERKSARRFKDLVTLLKDNLRGVKVYKFGEVEIDVYVIGTTPSGDLAGVTTKVIET